MQEDGNFALTVIGRNLMQAGYGKMVTATTTNLKGLAGRGLAVGQGLTACDNGFTDPLATAPDFTCATSGGQPGLTVAYAVDAYDATNSPTSGAGADCNGNDAGGMVTNSFFIATKSGESSQSLFCSGNGSTTSQPILNNVDKMVVTYGVDTTGANAVTKFFSVNGASSVAALPPNTGNNKKNWDQVVSVTICLELHSANSVTTNGAQTYLNCSATSTTATDKKLHAALTRTFTLRNRAAPTLAF
ncbi:PilW family protein [Collimonas antrihumi]|uniref:PilW family protein n=1 Tax=Collimonas antrihumi TaxID=1940615 RepID=UPI001FE2E6C3|nr:PilW family protein [Collimonas antrihumi]